MKSQAIHKKKKVKFLIITLSILCIIIWCVFFLLERASIFKFFNEHFSINEVSELDLTEDQRLYDFDYLCNVIEDGMPALESFNNEYNLNYNDVKKIYRERIKHAGTDFEFYCFIKSFLNYIPSVHTSLCNPNYSYYLSLNCINQENIPAVRGIKEYSEYWSRIIEANTENTDYGMVYCATYNESDGYYYFNDGSRITLINGSSVDEYVKITPMIYPLKYDFINQKLFRQNIFFSTNNCGGNTQTVFMINDSETIKMNLFGGGITDYMIVYYDNNHSNDESLSEELLKKDDYYIVFDDENMITYAEISNITHENCSSIRQLLTDRKYNTVVLDLRNNTGGFPQMFFDNIYTPLCAENSTATFTWYIPCTETNKKNVLYYNPLYCRYTYLHDEIKYAKNIPLPDMNTNYLERTYEYSLIGNDKISAQLYVLISSETASAADKLANVLKQQNAVLIGNSTGGEGTGGSFAAEVLPNSKLVITYYPSIAYNSDGTYNNLHGISPDYFVYETDFDQLNTMKEIYRSGENIYTYENRLKWDNVLIETLELIKEDENDKGNNTADE